MTVYQRTPAWVVPRTDHPVKPLLRRLYRFVPGLQKAIRGALYLFREFLVIGMAKQRAFLRPVGKLAKAHLHRQVRDPKLRKALMPDYTIGCKRILISNDYFPAVAAPNAELVTAGIAEIRPTSIVTTDGVERPTDTIVLATGFHVTDLPIAEKICGRDGRSLADVWSDGMVTNRSAAVAGFPNLFLLVGPNVGVGHTSMVYMIESQVAYVDDALRTMDAEGLEVLETTPEAQAAYRDLIAKKSEGTVWLAGGCASWYLDKHGHNTTLWPDFTFRFRKLTRKLDRENYVGTAAGAPVTHGGGGVTATPTVCRRVAAVPTPDGATLHATVTGRDDAPVTVVMAHGWTLAQAAWDDVAELLTPRVAAGELRVVRYDQRGHGRSTWGEADISIDQLGDDLERGARPAGTHRPGGARRALDGRHDDHGARRGAAGAVRRPRPRCGAGVDGRRGPHLRPAQRRCAGWRG